MGIFLAGVRGSKVGVLLTPLVVTLIVTGCTWKSHPVSGGEIAPAKVVGAPSVKEPDNVLHIVDKREQQESSVEIEENSSELLFDDSSISYQSWLVVKPSSEMETIKCNCTKHFGRNYSGLPDDTVWLARNYHFANLEEAEIWISKQAEALGRYQVFNTGTYISPDVEDRNIQIEEGDSWVIANQGQRFVMQNINNRSKKSASLYVIETNGTRESRILSWSNEKGNWSWNLQVYALGDAIVISGYYSELGGTSFLVKMISLKSQQEIYSKSWSNEGDESCDLMMDEPSKDLVITCNEMDGFQDNISLKQQLKKRQN